MPAAGHLFFVFFSIYYCRDCLRKKHEIWEQKLWSEHFLIYSRLRQMNIESLFVLCANISSISIGGKVARESAARESTQNFSDLSDTRSFLRLSFFFFSDHALHVDLLSFIQDVEAVARWLRLRREGKYFRWTFGKLSVTHAKWLRQIFESTNINFDQIRIRDPISAREKVSLSGRSRWWNEKNYVNSRKRQTKENKSKIVHFVS